MIPIDRRLAGVDALPLLLEEIRHRIRFHTESGFTMEEADGYAQQLHEIEKILVPLWRERFGNGSNGVRVRCAPILHGFLQIEILPESPEGKEPRLVFKERYEHFDPDMCDRSFHQFLYQRVLSFQEDVLSGAIER